MIIAAMYIAAVVFSSPDLFTVSAEVRDSVTLRSDIAHTRTYLIDPLIFRRHFPGIAEIRRISATQSEWTIEVKPPLSGTRRTTYVVNERASDANTMIIETDPGARDYMYCRASIAPAPDTSTVLTLELKLQSSREHGSDIHFLAPLLGEDFISARMRDQLKDDISTFFRRIGDELR